LKQVWKKFKPRASGRFLKLERFQRCLKKNHNKERLKKTIIEMVQGIIFRKRCSRLWLIWIRIMQIENWQLKHGVWKFWKWWKNERFKIATALVCVFSLMPLIFWQKGFCFALIGFCKDFLLEGFSQWRSQELYWAGSNK
jgi:hypothetical protein